MARENCDFTVKKMLLRRSYARPAYHKTRGDLKYFVSTLALFIDLRQWEMGALCFRTKSLVRKISKPISLLRPTEQTMTESQHRTNPVDPPISESWGRSSRSQCRSISLPTIMSGIASSFSSSERRVMQASDARNGQFSIEGDSSDSAADDDSIEYSLSALKRSLRRSRVSGVSQSNASSDASSSSSDSPWIDVSDSSSESYASSRDSFDPKESLDKICDVPPLDSISSAETFTIQSSQKSKNEFKGKSLYHVQYVPSIDAASTNQDVSTISPIGVVDARPAFIKEPEPPKEKLSSMAYSSRVLDEQRRMSAMRPMKHADEHRLRIPIDEECAFRHSSNTPKELEKIADKGDPSASCNHRRAGVEIFFVVLISLCIIALIILVAVLVGRKH